MIKLKDLLTESVNEEQINEWKLQLDLGKVNPSEFENWASDSLQKKHKIKVSGSGRNWTIVGKGNDDRMGSSADWITQLLGKSWRTNKIKVVQKESVNEAMSVDPKKVYGGTGAKEGMVLVAQKGLDKVLELSKKNPSNVFLVSDDNYTNFGPFYVKNGKIAKYTVANPNYDLEKNKVRSLKVPSDVILKFKIVEGVTESINEADYQVYHKSFTDAADAARKMAEKRGFEIDEDDWQTQVALGGSNLRSRPSVGKETRFTVGLIKNGKPQRKALNFQVYGMKNGYELNAYIN